MDIGSKFNHAKQLTPETPRESPVAITNTIQKTESIEAERCSPEDKFQNKRPMDTFTGNNFDGDNFDGPVVIKKVFREMSMFKSIEQYQEIYETVLIEPKAVPATIVEEESAVDEIGTKVFGEIPKFGSVKAYQGYFENYAK